MRRGSVSMSSTFKVNTEKGRYEKYLARIDSCNTVKQYPHLQESIENVSRIIYNYCYEMPEDSPFMKGLNYNGKNLGFSLPHSSSLVYREWVPNAKTVVLALIEESRSDSYPLKRSQEDPNMWEVQIKVKENQIDERTKILLTVVDEQGQTSSMAPPSSRVRLGDYGVLWMNVDLPVPKQAKKKDIIQAYTLDLALIPLAQATNFLEQNSEILSKFNTIIIRNLFESKFLIDRHSLELQDMEIIRDVVSKSKNELGLRVILEWGFEPGSKKYSNNPIEDSLLLEEEPGVWQYDLSKKEATIIYLSRLSYFLTTLKLDGFHFKRIESFAKNQHGQVLIRCMNLMNSRINQAGFTLASSKVEIPGLNQPILEGGLGFTFSYSYTDNFMDSKSHLELNEKFGRVVATSNCIPVNLDLLSREHEMNFLFSAFVSGKGVFCKGCLKKNQSLIEKVLLTRNQAEIFEREAEVILMTDSAVVVSRGPAYIVFNFSESETKVELEGAKEMELINCFGAGQPELLQDEVKMGARSCCILQD